MEALSPEDDTPLRSGMFSFGLIKSSSFPEKTGGAGKERGWQKEEERSSPTAKATTAAGIHILRRPARRGASMVCPVIWVQLCKKSVTHVSYNNP